MSLYKSFYSVISEPGLEPAPQPLVRPTTHAKRKRSKYEEDESNCYLKEDYFYSKQVILSATWS